MSSAIVQKVHGVIANLGAGGTISFPNPTVDGNCVLVTFAFVSTHAITGSESIADPANGNCFFPGSDPTAISYNGAMSGGGTFTIFTTLQSKSVLGGTTLHVDSLQTMTFSGFTGQTQAAYVWMYEIAYIGAPALVAGPPFAAWWNVLNSPAGSNAVNASATPVSPDLAQVPGDVTDGGGATGPMLCVCTIIADGSPNWTGVADGTGSGAVWTMDVVQNGIAVAYAEPAGIGDQQAQFTNGDGSHNYAALFYVVADTQPVAATGNIIIQKATVPGGSPQSFTFTPSYGAPFQLTDGQSNDSGALAPGSYSVVETPVAGWDTAVSGNPANILVVVGQTTTVTFTNTERLCQLTVSPASLSFVKDQCGTLPLPKSFTLTNVGNADAIPFTVSADQPWVILNPTAGSTPATIQVSVDLLGLAPGTYTATISFLSSCGNPVVPTVLVVLVVGQTVVAACIPDPNADAENVPSLNGVFTSLVSSGQVVNPVGFPPGTYNFQSFTQAGPDVTAFGGELFSTLCGRQRIIMVVPDQYDDDGVGIDCQYLPWLAQMPPNVLGHGGFRAQLQGNGVIRMTPLNEKNDNRYKPLEVLLAPGPPVSFEKGVRATEKYLGILFSNKKICGAFFIIQELVQYANAKYGGSRSPKS